MLENLLRIGRFLGKALYALVFVGIWSPLWVFSASALWCTYSLFFSWLSGQLWWRLWLLELQNIWNSSEVWYLRQSLWWSFIATVSWLLKDGCQRLWQWVWQRRGAFFNLLPRRQSGAERMCSSLKRKGFKAVMWWAPPPAPLGSADVWMLAPDCIALADGDGVINNDEGSWVRVMKGDSPKAASLLWSFEPTPPPTRHPTPLQVMAMENDDVFVVEQTLTVSIEELHEVN